MTLTTPHYEFRYPENTDPPAGHLQIKALAEDVEDSMVIRSAKASVIAAEQTTTSTSFVELGTPDRCEDIALPTDGLIVVTYQA